MVALRLLLIAMVGLSVLAGQPAVSGRPIHISILSRYSESLSQAKAIFDQRYGQGLIELHLAETTMDPKTVENSDAIVLHYAGVAAFSGLSPAVRRMRNPKAVEMAVPADNMERLWGIKPQPNLQARAEKLWTAGGAENLASSLALLYNAAGGERAPASPGGEGGPDVRDLASPGAEAVFLSPGV
jgi:hypothetical protein